MWSTRLSWLRLCAAYDRLVGRVRLHPSIALSATIVFLSLSFSPAEGRIITANGTLKPISSITLGSNVSGTVEEMVCEVNSPVSKGQVCARIDPRPFERAVEMGRANLAAAFALLEQHAAALVYAKANFDRNASLIERGVVSRNTFESIRSAYEQALAQVNLDKAFIEQRKAELAAAELNLGYTAITSPIDGLVLQRLVTAGETVAATIQSPSLFVISSNLDRMQIATRVSEGDIGEFKAGDQVSFTVKAFPNRQFAGKVERIPNMPTVSGNEVVYEVVIGFDNKDLLLRPGMTAIVRLDTVTK